MTFICSQSGALNLKFSADTFISLSCSRVKLKKLSGAVSSYCRKWSNISFSSYCCYEVLGGLETGGGGASIDWRLSTTISSAAQLVSRILAVNNDNNCQQQTGTSVSKYHLPVTFDVKQNFGNTKHLETISSVTSAWSCYWQSKNHPYWYHCKSKKDN